jgi:hypothetical protein
MTSRSRDKQARAAAQLTDLMTVAPQVVVERVSRMAASAARSTPASRREAQRMISEKMEASAESMTGVALAAMRINAQFTSLMLRPWLGGPGKSASGAAGIADFVQGAAADLTSSAVKPMLRKAKANARRLSR